MVRARIVITVRIIVITVRGIVITVRGIVITVRVRASGAVPVKVRVQALVKLGDDVH